VGQEQFKSLARIARRMEPLDLSGLGVQPLLLLDTAPIIYCLEDHAKFAARFQPLFEAHRNGSLRFAVTTITLAEVMTGPLNPETRLLRAAIEPFLSPGR
jgi:hypothetical protein